MKPAVIKINPRRLPPLDKDFRPAALECGAFREAALGSGGAVPVAIALERGEGLVSSYKTFVLPEGPGNTVANLTYIERMAKTLLWIWGGYRIIFGGPAYIGEYLRNAYAPGGLRDFDARFMSRVYEKEFGVVTTCFDSVPEAKESSRPVGGHFRGCRIGFDAGGSDRKVSAVIDGKAVYSEEVIWHPKLREDPEYHYNEILTAMKTAAAHMPRVDAIGISAAGIYINNRVAAASLFIKVSEELFNSKVRDIFIRVQREMGNVPMEVANDGDVTAIAGAMELRDTNILGIAMGTSEAAGYTDSKGCITGWLNELAFVPVDFNPRSAVDEWSGDYGCGVKYFSQDAVARLAPSAGITLDSGLYPAEKLKAVQALMADGDLRARAVFESIGCYLGYSLAYYADFYDIRHVLLLGRVTSGEGGSIILDTAREVLRLEFPTLYRKIRLHLPDEAGRRIGQSVAAASLPEA